MGTHATVRTLRRAMALFTALLVVSTWPLWTPGTGFPDIPWFAWAVGWPPEEWDWLWLAALAGLIASQFVPAGFESRRLTIARGLLFSAAVMLLPTDQHRLQPWVWQMLIGGLIIGLSPSDRLTLRLLRWFTISIYFWSAVSKFDWAFIEGHGQVLLNGLADAVGLSRAFWSPQLTHALAALFPLGEMLIAVLLVIPRSQRIGLWAAIAMHGLLMLTVGPLGLNHEWGVFVWNAYFGVQAWLLFGRPLIPDAEIADGRERTVVAKILVWSASGLTCLVCCLPALSLIGRWDWWPSWAVYASRPAVVHAWVKDEARSKLPSSLAPFTFSEGGDSDSVMLALDAWSYDVCWCPMYPQERYRMAVIGAVIPDRKLLDYVKIRSTPDRWTGERRSEGLNSSEFDRRLQSYWFNTQPRGTTPQNRRATVLFMMGRIREGDAPAEPRRKLRVCRPIRLGRSLALPCCGLRRFNTALALQNRTLD